MKVFREIKVSSLYFAHWLREKRKKVNRSEKKSLEGGEMFIKKRVGVGGGGCKKEEKKKINYKILTFIARK